MIRRVEKHLNKTKETTEQLKQEHQEETQTNNQTTNPKNHQDIPKTNSTPKTPKQTDYSDPEVTRQMVKRNRQIKEDITNFDKIESENQKAKIKQQIEYMKQTLNNLTMKLAAEEQNTDTNDSDQDEQTHTDEEEDNQGHNDDFSDTEQNEETENQQEPHIPINIISMVEFDEMESKLPQNCKDRFEQVKDNYEQNKLNIDNTAMHLSEKIEANDESPQHYQQMQKVKEHLINLRQRQITTEQKIRNIAKAGGKNNLNIIMPKFGHNMSDFRQWKGIPNFNPKNDDAMPLDTIWTLITAKGQRENLCEEAYKDILENILKGRALHYYTVNSTLPLQKIIETLFNAFVTTKSRQQLRTQINNFKAEKNQSFRQTLEGLRLLVREYFKDLPSGTRELEEDAEIRRCISEQKLANPIAIANVIRKQHEFGYDGRSFDFLAELVRETDILQEAGNPYNQNGITDTLAIYSTATQNEPTRQPQSAEPKRIHIGQPGQHGISAKPRQPTEEKLDRLFRHSQKGHRPRSNSPNSPRSRQQANHHTDQHHHTSEKTHTATPKTDSEQVEIYNSTNAV